MSQAAVKTALTGCLAPIDKDGLEQLIAKGKADPKVIKTLKCKTVAEGRFRHLNFIRSLPAYVVDEPPGLLGDDTAPNPSEASLAALGSCLAVGIHANAVARGITVFKLEIELEGDLNITGGVGHRRHFGKAGRLHRRARQGDVRGRPAARGARGADRARETGRRWPTPSRARSISRSNSPDRVGGRPPRAVSQERDARHDRSRRRPAPPPARGRRRGRRRARAVVARACAAGAADRCRGFLSRGGDARVRRRRRLRRSTCRA